MNRRYYTAETDANGHVNNADLWKLTGADNLTTAKMIATRRQVFQGSAMHIGEKRGDEIVTVAVKRGDALNMNAGGSWVDTE